MAFDKDKLMLVKTIDKPLMATLFSQYGGGVLATQAQYHNARNWPYLYTVRLEDRNIGIVFAGPIGGGKIRITLAVLPEYQGGGLGKRIMELTSKTTGYGIVQGVVRNDNAASLGMMRSAGFKTVEIGPEWTCLEKDYTEKPLQKTAGGNEMEKNAAAALEKFARALSAYQEAVAFEKQAGLDAVLRRPTRPRQPTFGFPE